jgi:O-antigen ligase
MTGTVSPIAQRLLFASLLIWAIGTQTLEGISTAGFACCLAVVVVIALRRWSLAGAGRVIAAWGPLWMFIAWALLVPLLAGRKPAGVGIGRLTDWLGLPAAAFAFSCLSRGQRRALAWSTAIVFLVSCGAAFLQYFGKWPPLERFHALHWTRIPFSRVYEPIAGQLGRFYGGGLQFHRLKFSHAGALVIIAAFAVALGQRGWRRLAPAVVVAAGVLTILVASQARAAIVALAVALLVMMLVAGVRLRKILAVSVLLALAGGVVLVASPGTRSRFAHTFDHESNGDRGAIWKVATRAIRSSPWVGVGLGQFQIRKFATSETPFSVEFHEGKAHNQFMTFAAETGIPGAILFVLLLIWLFVTCRGAGAAVGRGAVTFFAVLSCSHDPLFHATVSMGVMLLCGIARALGDEGT